MDVRIVDAHVHVNRFDLMRPEVQATIRSNPTFPLMERFVEDPRAFLDHMDAEGVEQAWLVNYCAKSVMGYGPEVNPWVAKYVEADPKRLVAVGGFEPDDPHLGKSVEALWSMGIRAVKLHAVHQHLRPDDARLTQLYKAMEAHRMPLLVHTGTSRFPGADNAFADPTPLHNVCAAYPDLPVILAHGGRPHHTSQALAILGEHRNAWLDVSSCPPHRLHDYFGDLRRLADRTLWGSDWPGPGVPGMKSNVDAFRALGLGADVERKVLGENAKRLLERSR